MTSFRNATLAELNLMLDWAADEGWNPGLDDAHAFYTADPEGFFVATDNAGTAVAAISVVNQAADFAFLGLYIVRPEHRGKGIGLALWTHAMDHAGQRTIGLDGVEAQQDNYKTSGFVHAGGTTRFTGTLSGMAHTSVTTARPEDIAALVTLEARCSGVEKPDYLSPWFAQRETRMTFLEQSASGPRAFCTIRRCRTGAKIGPLVAEDADAARRLLEHAASVFEGPYIIDVPAPATQLAALCTELAFEPGFRTARMYRGDAPHAADPLPFFAVTSLELG